MGSTIAALFFDPLYDVVAVSHVGDTRVFRVRGMRIEQLTEDHTVVQDLVNQGRMTDEDARTSPLRHRITQAVGTADCVAPSLGLEVPRAGDVFVLTSDGVHDPVAPTEIAEVVRDARGDLELVCLRLIDLANLRGGRDNSTVLVVRCDEPRSG